MIINLFSPVLGNSHRPLLWFSWSGAFLYSSENFWNILGITAVMVLCKKFRNASAFCIWWRQQRHFARYYGTGTTLGPGWVDIRSSWIFGIFTQKLSRVRPTNHQIYPHETAVYALCESSSSEASQFSGETSLYESCSRGVSLVPLLTAETHHRTGRHTNQKNQRHPCKWPWKIFEHWLKFETFLGCLRSLVGF